MRLSGALAGLVAVGFLASCATTTPHRAPSIQAALDLYQGPQSAPKVLDAVHQAMDQGATLDSEERRLYGLVALAAQEWDLAAEVLGPLVDTDAEIRITLAQLALSRRHWEEATSLIQKIDPQTPEGLRFRARLAEGLNQNSVVFWQKLVQIQVDPEALAALARAAESRSNFGDALDFWNRAVEASPNDASLRLSRARLLWRHFQNAKLARPDLDKALGDLPDEPSAWRLLAQVSGQQGDGATAYSAWKNVQRLAPQDVEAQASIAFLAFRYRDWERAAQNAHDAGIHWPGDFAFPVMEALSQRALGNPSAYQTILSTTRVRFQASRVVSEFFQFLLVPGSDARFNQAFNQERSLALRVRLRFYQGCYYALIHAESSARAALLEASMTTTLSLPESGAAQDWLTYGF